ncbi:MAG: alkaline phosphatase D family protein [Candidatus Methylacidiphilales bacterium]|nr:alkaline phosphatase D family protein [Candidatus Methylacidiphilales bacterium]
MKPIPSVLFLNVWIVPILALVSCSPRAAEPGVRLLAGPMPGWSGHREVEIWAMVEGNGRPAMSYRRADAPDSAVKIALPEVQAGDDGKTILRYHPSLLDPGTRYVYTLDLPGYPNGTEFQTQADWAYKKPAPDFSFVFGSCLYMNDAPYDRPGKPYGQGEGILGLMARSRADFMLWLGDNLYLRPADWTSPAGIRYRYTHDRSDPSLQDLLRSMHHFAIWDDHDFGPNDSSKTFPLRDVSRKTFRDFWANPPSGLPEPEGIMFSFVWSDCLFVMLDDRSNRDANELELADHPGKTMLGARQIEWLEQTLLQNREATFKFVVQGGQFLKDHTFESYADFPADRRRILDFIRKEKIDGVMFLSGDRHFSELNRMEIKGAYPLYDLTSSPIGSGVAANALKLEAVNPMRVEGTLVDLQNFCRIDVRGEGREERTLTLSCMDKNGTERWKKDIPARALRHP